MPTHEGSPASVAQKDEDYLKYGLSRKKWDGTCGPDQIEKYGRAFELNMNKESYPLKINKKVAILPSDNTIFSPDEKKPQYYKDIDSTLLLPYGEKKAEIQRGLVLAIFSQYEKIVTRPATVAVYKHFLKVGASYVKELAQNTETPISTVYRAIDQLSEAGLIIPVTKLEIRKSHGVRPTLWGIEGSTEEEQQRAAQRYIKSKRKTYKLVQELVQRTLPEIHDEAIQFTKICFIAKRMGSRSFHFIDLAEQAALDLKDQGITILQ